MNLKALFFLFYFTFNTDLSVLNAQVFNRLHYVNDNYLFFSTSTALDDSTMMVIFYDTFNYPPAYSEKSWLLGRLWLSVYDKVGNRFKRLPAIFKDGDTIFNYNKLMMIDNRLIGRAFQYIPTDNKIYPLWVRYTEFDKKTLAPTTKSVKEFIGYINPDSIINAGFWTQNAPINSTFLGKNYSFFNFKLFDVNGIGLGTLFYNFVFDINQFNIKFKTNKDYKLKNILYNNINYYLSDRIKTIGGISYDTFGQIFSPDYNYSANYNYNLDLIDTYQLKQNTNKYIVGTGDCSNYGIVMSNSEVHNFGYNTIYEKTNGKYVDSIALVHYKLKGDSIIFQKFIGEKYAYKAKNYFYGKSTENIVSNKDKTRFLIYYTSNYLGLNKFRVFKLDTNLNLIWNKDYVDSSNPMCCFKNVNHAYNNELGGFNLTFEGIDTNLRSGLYMLKIDANGNAIKLTGKDLSKNSIAESISSSDISIYPNPASTLLNIDGLRDRDLEYQIIDLSGRKLLANKLDKQHIDVTNLVNGVYFLDLKTKNGMSIVKKFEIRR